jgi:dUTP pyrophosphatase
MNTVSIKILKIYEDVLIPERQTIGSAGYDLYSYCPNGLEIPPITPIFIPTGIKIEIPPNYDIEIRPRSGLSTKNLLFLPNSPGTIDSDYRGEIMVCMVNFSKTSFMIEHKMRIAQIILRQNISIKWEIANSLLNTDRGSGGFGSTGV